MKLIFLIFLFTSLIFSSTVVFAQTEYLNPFDSFGTVSNEPANPYQLDFFLGITSIGIMMWLSMQYIPKLKKLREQSKKEVKDDDESPYAKLPITQLEKLADRLTINYTVLITIYSVLLAFIVSDKASLAFQSWYFILWCGWIIAIIIRVGHVTLSFFEIDETHIKQFSNELYAAKEIFKHSLFLLIPTIAFLPTFFVNDIPTEESILALPWAKEWSIIFAGIGIIACTVFFYEIPLKLTEFTKANGAQGTYMIVISLFIMGLAVNFISSPLDPMPSKFGEQVYYIPAIFVAISIGGIVFFGIMLRIYYRMLPEKIRKYFDTTDEEKKTKSKRQEK